MGVHSKTGRRKKGLFGRRRRRDESGQADSGTPAALDEVKPIALLDGPSSSGTPGGIDPLTGLARRDALLAHLAIMDGRAAALVLFDMDDFGRYNDQWGRAAGDDAIRAIGATLAGAAGDRGQVFRSGGDQFAAVIETGADQNGSASAWAHMAHSALSPLAASGAVVVLRHGNRPEATLRDGELTLVALKEAGGAMIGAHGPHVDAWARSRRHEVGALAAKVEELQMENQRLNQSMLVDPLTGLPNASAFDADHTQLDYRRRRSDDPYALVLVEFDRFDELCAVAGEEAGLEAQKAVATTISRTVRGSDRAYTMGGCEYAVLLPGSQMREAVVAAERCRLRVEKLAIPHPGNPEGIVTVTLAAMAAGFRHQSTKEVMIELENLLATGADKHRNRVIWPV